MIIWSGWGLLVPVIYFVAFLLTVPIFNGLKFHHDLYEFGVASLIACLATGILATVVRGSFFFIPMPAWFVIQYLAGVGISAFLLIRGH